MYNFNSSWNGSREVTPLMVRRNGRLFDWIEPEVGRARCGQPEPESEPARIPAWMSVAGVAALLVLSLPVLIALAISL